MTSITQPSRYPDRYASHAHVLGGILAALHARGLFPFRPAVIELGMGYYSTLLLRAVAHSLGGIVSSFESEKAWGDRFGEESYRFVNCWETFQYPQEIKTGSRVAMVFVDHADMGSRGRHAAEALAFAPIVVLHDSAALKEPDVIRDCSRPLADAAHSKVLFNTYFPGTLVASSMFNQDQLEAILSEIP